MSGLISPKFLVPSPYENAISHPVTVIPAKGGNPGPGGSRIMSKATGHGTSTPQNLSGSVSGGNVVLTWDDPDDATITGYQIMRRTLGSKGADGKFTVIEENTQSASTSYTDTNVEPGMRYAYRIRAINAGGSSSVPLLSIGMPMQNRAEATNRDADGSGA